MKIFNWNIQIPQAQIQTASDKKQGAAPFETSFSGIKSFIYNTNSRPKATVKSHIEFEPAKTLEDAKIFAQENLGIDKFELKNLDCANYINEGLSEYYNKLKDKSAVINAVVPKKSSHAAIFADDIAPTLFVNEQMMENAGSAIRIRAPFGLNLESIYKLTDKQKDYIGRFSKDKNSLSLKEKMGLMEYASEINSIQRPFFSYSDAIKNKEVQERFEATCVPLEYEKFKRIGGVARARIMKNMFKKTNYTISVPDGGDFKTLNRAMAHRVYENEIGYKQYRKMSYKAPKNRIAAYNDSSRFFKEEKLWHIIASLSNNAATSPAAFVSEIYAGLLNGEQFSPEIMDLYKKYNGVMPSIAH